MAALLVGKKGRSIAVILLFFWLLVMAAIQFYYLCIFYSLIPIPETVFVYWSVLPLLASPLYFLYVKSITGYGINWKKAGLHLLPVGVLIAALVWLELAQHEIHLESGFVMSHTAPWFGYYYGYLYAIVPIVYITWSLILVHRFKKHLLHNQSTISPFEMKWLEIWVAAALVSFLLSFPAVYLAAHYQLFELSLSYKLVGLLNTIYIFALSYFGFRKTSLFTDLAIRDTETTNTKTYEKSGLATYEMARIANKMTDHLKQQKPYLNPHLTLRDLSEALDLSTHHLSQMLNQHLHISFYKLINQHRVNEAKERIKSGNYAHQTLLSIGLDAGFNSKATFNKAFKEITGHTPVAFQKKNERK